MKPNYFNALTKYEISSWIGYYRNGLSYWEISNLIDAPVLLVRNVIENYLNGKK